jgi:hypothetical protein
VSADITSGRKASWRSLMIVIPTTRRPVVIVSLKPRPNLPASFVVAEGDFRALPITPDYDWLIGPSGPVGRRVPDVARSSQELKLSESFESGRSWEVPVSLAHLLVASGRRLTGRAEDADLLLWSTGAVDVDLNIADQNYFLEEKLRRSLDLFAAAKGKTIIAFIPSCGLGVAGLAPDLREQLAALDVELVPMASVVEAFDQLTVPAQSLETGARGAGTTSSGLSSSMIRAWVALGLLVAASASVAAGFFAGPSIFLHFLHDGPTRRVPLDRDTPQADVAKTNVARSGVPKTGAPKTEVPNSDLAKADVPNTDLVNTGLANTDSAKADTEVPKTEVPKTEVPEVAKIDVPNVPKADFAKSEVPKSDEAKTDVAKTDVPSAKLPERSLEQPQSSGPDAMMVLEELRAPARLSCIDVLFSGAAPEVHVLTAVGGRFPPSSTAGLCGLRARVTASSATNRAPAYKVDFDAAFLAISMPAQDDPGSRALGRSSRMFRRDAPALLSYRIVMRSLPGSANPLELQFTHELRK